MALCCVAWISGFRASQSARRLVEMPFMPGGTLFPVDEKKVVHPTALAGNGFSMTDPVSTSDPQAVHAAVLEMFQAASPGSSAQRLDTVFARSRDCFEGRCPGYLPIDAR